MRPGDILPLVWSALRGHALRSRMTYAAIAIGVASVLTLTALGEGARTWVMNQFATLGANALIVLPGRTETRGSIPLLPATTRDITLDDARAVRSRLAGAVRVIPVVVGEASVSHEGRSRASMIVGSTSDYLGLIGVEVRWGQNLPRGEFESDPRVCVVGRTLARELSGEADPVGMRVRIGEYAYRVIGVLAPRGQSMMVNLDEAALIPVAGALKIFNRAGLFRLIVQISAAGDLARAQRGLEYILKDRHDGEEDFTILTPGAIAGSFDAILKILTIALAGIAGISLAVAGVGVMNVMVVAVVERSPEIGLMKALGAARGQILTLFLAEAATLSVLGGILGTAGGYLLVRLASAFVSDIPFRIPAWAPALALGVAGGTGLVFGLLPAARAARLDPQDALRRKA